MKLSLTLFFKLKYLTKKTVRGKIYEVAAVMELADVADSKSAGSDTVPVRLRPAAPKNPVENSTGFCFYHNSISNPTGQWSLPKTSE